MEKKITPLTANNRAREEHVKNLLSHLQETQDAFLVKSNKICYPTLNELGDEIFIEITVSVPRGSRDGDAYNGYELKAEYEESLQENIRKEQERQAKKQRDIERKKKKKEKDEATE